MDANESVKYVIIIDNLLRKIKEQHASCACDGFRNEIDEAINALGKLEDKIDKDYWEIMEAHLGPHF